MRLVRSEAALLLLFLCLAINVQQYRASRTLHEWRGGVDSTGKLGKMLAAINMNIQSLSRGPVTPSGPSGCTYIPGGGGTSCPVNEMHFAGDALRRAPPARDPRTIFLSRVAADQKQM